MKQVEENNFFGSLEENIDQHAGLSMEAASNQLFDAMTSINNLINDNNRFSIKLTEKYDWETQYEICNYAKKLNLECIIGSESQNYIVVAKKSDIESVKFKLTISNDSFNLMKEFLTPENEAHTYDETGKVSLHPDYGKIIHGIRKIPSNSCNFDVLEFRKKLPIWRYKEEILKKLNKHRVLFITGNVGLGKSSQVPQLLLEHATKNKKKCRIICAQPRASSVISLAKRVAFERAEKCGKTSGYYLRFESCASNLTPLIFCTYETLLRTIVSGNKRINSVTHIILDEIHERDHLMDLVLALLRDMLQHNYQLTLILMFTTIDLSKLQNYFKKFGIVKVTNSFLPVNELFLEELLDYINYDSKEVQKYKRHITDINDKEETMEMILRNCVNENSDKAFDKLIHFVKKEINMINYRTEHCGYTALIVAAMHGKTDVSLILLQLGADVTCRSRYKNFNATNWATEYKHFNLAKLLSECEKTFHLRIKGPSFSMSKLSTYKYTVTHSLVDIYLIIAIIHFILVNGLRGNILVYLSCYEDIINLKNEIEKCKFFYNDTYEIVIVDELMQTAHARNRENNEVKKQKFIFATHVAEDQMLSGNIQCVIDSGRIMERSYNMANNTYSMELNWISKGSVKQRTLRAGFVRGGICFHLYTKETYCSFPFHTVPKITKVSLQDLCLYIKMYSAYLNINEVLKNLLTPPSFVLIDNAIFCLKSIGALDEKENITILGEHIINIPIEPHLAKMLIFAEMFQCTDPIFTIVAFLSYKDPFITTDNLRQLSQVAILRKSFTKGFFSDHLLYLNLFQTWLNACSDNNQNEFCNKYYLNVASMNVITTIRLQLLEYIKARCFFSAKKSDVFFVPNQYSNNWALIKAVLLTGYFPRIAYVNKDANMIYSRVHDQMVLSTSSSLRRMKDSPSLYIKYIPTDWIIYDSCGEAPYYIIESASCINNLTVALLLGHILFLPTSNILQEHSVEEINDNSSFHHHHHQFICECPLKIMKTFLEVRDKMRKFINYRLKYPQKEKTVHDVAFLQMISHILCMEDKNYKLIEPGNVHSPFNYYKQMFNLNLSQFNENRSADTSLLDDTIDSASLNSSTINSHSRTKISNTHFDDIDDSTDTLICKTIPSYENTIFWLIRCSNLHTIEKSVIKNLWKFEAHELQKLISITRCEQDIYFIFSSTESNCYHGIAKLIEILYPIEEQLIVSNANIKIQWLSRADLPINSVLGMNLNCLQNGYILNYNIGISLWKKFMNLIPPYVKCHYAKQQPGRPITKNLRI